MDLHKVQSKIESKKDFVDFLKLLHSDFKINREDWENDTLTDFLEAISAYSEDMEGFYKNNDLPFDKDNPTWGNIAQIFLGAKVYE